MAGKSKGAGIQAKNTKVSPKTGSSSAHKGSGPTSGTTRKAGGKGRC